jgi:peptidyl-dipeptidase A
MPVMIALKNPTIRQICVVALLLTAGPAMSAENDAASRAREFLAAHEAKVRALERTSALAWWNANISGKNEDFKAK